MKYKRFSALTILASIALSGCYVDLGFIKFGKPSKNAEAYDAKADAEAISEYYSDINDSLVGNSLLNSLKALNGQKKEKDIGYSSMGTGPSGYFKYTDFDPASVKYNSEGVPFGTKILSFYSGISTTSFNREHVWPKSRGGDKVENDILMVRPTIKEENSDRGNSSYVTGKATEHNGWDPVTAFSNTIGVAESIRGECARIIFYCLTAATGLTLSDTTGVGSNDMGKLTDLVKWSCENPVSIREKRRNVGSQYVQGNRNAFVDHPEYVCRIWGNSNSSTKTA